MSPASGPPTFPVGFTIQIRPLSRCVPSSTPVFFLLRTQALCPSYASMWPEVQACALRPCDRSNKVVLSNIITSSSIVLFNIVTQLHAYPLQDCDRIDKLILFNILPSYRPVFFAIVTHLLARPFQKCDSDLSLSSSTL